jgi:ribosomal protein S18 acetylase RimI-like enzyme
MQDVAAAAAQSESVRRATVRDLPDLARALAWAFFDDPHARWIFRDDNRRFERLERGYVVGLEKLWLPHDECYTTAGVVGGVLWMPPGTWKLGVLQQLRLVPSLIGAYGRDLVGTGRLLALLDSLHPHEPDHWYLPMAGVAPDWQGRGIGSALLRPVLERCDADGLPAYLEATTERNRAMYERNGFEVMDEYRLWGGGPTGWRMWRQPRAGTTAPA